MMVKFHIINLMHRSLQPLVGLLNCADKIFRNIIDNHFTNSQTPMHFGMVIFGMLDIRSHTQDGEYSEHHHAINGYWVVDNCGDSLSSSRVLVTEITKVTQNNTGLHVD